MTAQVSAHAAGRGSELRPARMGFGDMVRVGAVGLRTRPMRAFLSALGIAIGIAAMVVRGGHLGVVAGRAGPGRSMPSAPTC